MIEIQGILSRLPHRYPFLLVDRIVELVPGESVHAIKNVTAAEPHFQGHFPDRPVMPGVLILEALAQAGGVLALETTGESIEGRLVLFRGIDRAKFRKQVVPGDQLHLHVRILRRRRNLWSLEAEARVEGEVVAEAELSAVIAEEANA